MLNPWQTLGVHRGSSPEEIRAAYLAIAKRFHPDINKNAGQHEKFREAAEAYGVLSDRKATSRLLKDYAVRCQVCGACDGVGCKLERRSSITAWFACTRCGGAGFLVNKQEGKNVSIKL